MKHNAIRLRLTKSEVTRLSELGHVEETIDFGPDLGGGFTYVLRIDPDEERVTARFGSGIIAVYLPVSAAESWIKTDQTGIESAQPVGNGDELNLIIEKDFACFNPRPGEDQSDNFSNPNSDTSC